MSRSPDVVNLYQLFESAGEKLDIKHILLIQRIFMTDKSKQFTCVCVLRFSVDRQLCLLAWPCLA